MNGISRIFLGRKDNLPGADTLSSVYLNPSGLLVRGTRGPSTIYKLWGNSRTLEICTVVAAGGQSYNLTSRRLIYRR
jgi:hypothetical protein